MVTVKQKTLVTQKLQGRATSHSRTDVNVRDRAMVIDEPLERGGTNQGFTPTDAAAVERVKRELAMFCPVSKVFRAAGIELKELWNVSRPK